MYLESFKVFCDLVATSSFSKSAQLNGITQSAVSQQIQAVEKRLNAKLIERGRGRLSLTPEGQIYYETCQRMMTSWAECEARMRELKDEVSGELRVASIFSIGLHELPPRLKAFREKYPQLKVKVQYGRAQEVYERVEDGYADIGLVAFPVKRNGSLYELFAEDKLVIIVPPTHALADRGHVPLSALDGERFVAFEPDAPTRKVTDRALRSAGVRVTHVAEFDNVETVKRAVEIESGISLVPESTVNQEVQNGQLRALTIEGEGITRPLGYVLSRNHPRPAGLKEFIATISGVEKPTLE